MELSTDDHIDWIADSIEALSRAGDQHGEVSVPDCPGWTVGHVVDHVARSVGIGWASWLQHGPDIDGLAVFAELPPMEPGQSGQQRFNELMPKFVELARSVSPDKPTYFWSGPATLSRLLQWTATEMGVHVNDIGRATGVADEVNTPARALSGLHVTAEFFSEIWGSRYPDQEHATTVRLSPSDVEEIITTGPDGEPLATAHGTALELLLSLFGRDVPIQVSGDPAEFEAWRFGPKSPVE